MEIDCQSIGRRIKEFRVARNWTRAKLAEESGTEPSNISHIERAATKVSLPTLIRISNALEVSLDEIVYGSLVKNDHISYRMLEEVISDCTPQELQALLESLQSTKGILRRFKSHTERELF